MRLGPCACGTSRARVASSATFSSATSAALKGFACCFICTFGSVVVRLRSGSSHCSHADAHEPCSPRADRPCVWRQAFEPGNVINFINAALPDGEKYTGFFSSSDLGPNGEPVSTLTLCASATFIAMALLQLVHTAIAEKSCSSCAGFGLLLFQVLSVGSMATLSVLISQGMRHLRHLTAI